MKKSRLLIKILSIFLLQGFLLQGYPQQDLLIAQAASEFEIEQIQAVLPKVTVYLRSEDPVDSEATEVLLDEKVLSVMQEEKFCDTEQSLDVFVLVDVSNSITPQYCKEIKNALNALKDELREQDKLVLITFGEEVQVLLEGEESSEARGEAIGTLHCLDRQTLLFEAMSQTADIADRMQDQARKVLLVISDGEDYTKGGSVASEVEQKLLERNLPVYAMGVYDTARENLNAFGATARTLGGEMKVFRAEEAGDVMQSVYETWMQTRVLSLQADTNIVTYRTVPLTVKNTKSGVYRKKEVLLAEYEKDTEQPKILQVRKIDDRHMEVTFSERVRKADENSSWNVMYEETGLPVLSAAYADESKTVVSLGFGETLYNGDYLIEAAGVADESMERNPVAGSVKVSLEGEFKPVPEEPQEDAKEQTWLQKWWWMLAVALLVILIITILIIWRCIRKNKGILIVDGKATLASNVSVKQKISLERTNALPITLEVKGAAYKGERKICAEINGSMIVGRASVCDLAIDDHTISRQHFALSYQDGKVAITDLDTTNGTRVNGVPVHADHALAPGDIIKVGEIELVISWEKKDICQQQTGK